MMSRGRTAQKALSNRLSATSTAPSITDPTACRAALYVCGEITQSGVCRFLAPLSNASFNVSKSVFLNAPFSIPEWLRDVRTVA